MIIGLVADKFVLLMDNLSAGGWKWETEAEETGGIEQKHWNSSLVETS